MISEFSAAAAGWVDERDERSDIHEMSGQEPAKTLAGVAQNKPDATPHFLYFDLFRWTRAFITDLDPKLSLEDRDNFLVGVFMNHLYQDLERSGKSREARHEFKSSLIFFLNANGILIFATKTYLRLRRGIDTRDLLNPRHAALAKLFGKKLKSALQRTSLNDCCETEVLRLPKPNLRLPHDKN